MVLGVVCWFAVDVSYINHNGEKENGFEAVRKLREEQKEWAGFLDEEKIKQVILENQRISRTPQARSNDYKQTPIRYDYMRGWTQLLEYAPTVIMVVMLILVYLVAGIFAGEFQWKSDAVFFTSVYGRNKAVAAKIKAGVCIVSAVYWLAILLYSGAVPVLLVLYGALTILFLPIIYREYRHKQIS